MNAGAECHPIFSVAIEGKGEQQRCSPPPRSAPELPKSRGSGQTLPNQLVSSQHTWSSWKQLTNIAVNFELLCKQHTAKRGGATVLPHLPVSTPIHIKTTKVFRSA